MIRLVRAERSERLSTRREMGSLESEVLMCLWAADEALSPAEVRSRLGGGLAYTTVLTVLIRLWQKELVGREVRGRGFAYRPLMSEAELAAERMHKDLRRTSDREAALAQFVGGLSEGEAQTLRRVIAGARRRANR